MKYIDRFLNAITMYKLVLYGLLTVALFAIVFGFLGIISFSGISLLLSVIILFTVCYVVNYVLALLFRVPMNSESYGITALILFFILVPPGNGGDYGILVLAAVLAMASKYILAIRRKHIFNPAAVSVLILSLFGIGNAIWWVATPAMLPLVAILGFLIVRKIRRFYLFLSFIITALASILIFGVLINHFPFFDTLNTAFLSFPLIFFGTIMLTEPLTTPSTNSMRIIYGAGVGILFGSQFHFGPVFATPEFALIVCNIFSFIVNPKYKLRLTLTSKKALAPDIYQFAFTTNQNQKLDWKPGQYFEWTLGHNKADIRGNRRYFTIASSPTEENVQIGTKFAEKKGSSFKSALMDLKAGDSIIAGQLTGDFVLPDEAKIKDTVSPSKLVFIAGGIGITPFRSMVKFLIDTNQKRDIIMFYAAQTADRFVYKDVFDEAILKVGLKTIYVFNDQQSIIPGFDGHTHAGFITKETILHHVPDFKDRLFYLSGPNAMVTNYKKLLLSLNVPRSHILTDYFPGF